MATKKPVLRPVIVCTEYKGVFYGYAADTSKDTVFLKNARMIIYWGTTRGVMELAATGPTSNSKLSLPADIEVRKVTAIIEVSKASEVKWKEVK